MTVYASRDHSGGMTVVSPGMGGCGQAHAYTVGPTGYPEITCGDGCEDFLATDHLHSRDPAEVPESHDERKHREAAEKAGTGAQERLTALALSKLAGIPGAAAQLDSLLSGGPAGPVPLPAACPAGHRNAGTARFCTECGTRITPAGVALCPDGHESPAGKPFCAECGQAITPAPPAATAKPPARKPPAGKARRPAGRAA